jgi:hypothetical protein
LQVLLLHGCPALRGPSGGFVLVGLMQSIGIQAANAAKQRYAQSQP